MNILEKAWGISPDTVFGFVVLILVIAVITLYRDNKAKEKKLNKLLVDQTKNNLNFLAALEENTNDLESIKADTEAILGHVTN